MVSIKNITYSYNRNSKPILENINFDVQDRECVGILGNNGTGKSTLLKCLSGICHTKNATVNIDGVNMLTIPRSKMAQKIAYVSQHNDISNMTVFDAVLLGRKPYIKWDATTDDRNIVTNIINELSLQDIQLKNLSHLSGGQVQKVMLARALAQQPHFLLLDEPTSSLDPYNQHEVLTTINKIAKTHNISVIIVIHDLNLAVRYCNKFLFLKDSSIHSYGDINIVTSNTINEIYGIKTDIIQHNNYKIIIPE